MSSNVTVSIIIPVFNSEKYLESCLHSVAAQDFQDYEVILVDDGSTDRSSHICDEYAKKYSNFCVFHKENGGVSSARNLALERARGEWVMFVDSDDEMPGDCLSNMLEKEADFILGGYARIEPSGETIHAPQTTSFYKKGEETGFFNLLSSTALFDASSAKLFKKSIIDKNGLRFNEALSYAEDKLFVYSFLLYAKSFCCVPKIVYRLIRREGSLSSNTCSDKHVGQLLVFLPLYIPVIDKLKEQYNCPTLDAYYHKDVIERYVFRILNIYKVKKCSTLTYANVRYLSMLINKDRDIAESHVDNYKSVCLKTSKAIGGWGLWLFIRLFSFYQRRMIGTSSKR